MIDFVRNKPEKYEDPKEKALDLLDRFHPSYMAWTPTKTFTMLIAKPASVAEHFRTEIDLSKKYIPALADDKPVLVQEVTRGDAFFLEFSGEGAANIARAARDKLDKNFVGSANIPDGRSKS